MQPKRCDQPSTSQIRQWGRTALFLGAALVGSFAVNGCGEDESAQPAVTTAAPTTTATPTATAAPTTTAAAAPSQFAEHMGRVFG